MVLESANPAWTAPESAPPLREFLAYGWMHRTRAGLAFAAVFLPLLLLGAALPVRYRAVATLAVLPSPEFTVREDAGSKDQNASALALDQIMKAETEILSSDELHERVLREIGVARLYPDLAWTKPPGAAMRALRWLLRPWMGPPGSGPDAAEEAALARAGDRLSVQASKDSNVINLAFGHGDAMLAARFLNELLSTYAARRSRLYDDPQLGVVRGETDVVARAAVQADQLLAAFKAAHRIENFEQQRDLLLKRESDDRQALADATAAAAEQTARMAALNRAIRTTPRSVGFYREQDTDERLQTVNDGLTELRGRLAAARVHYRESSRMVADLRRQIAAREAERARLAADPAPSLQRAGRPPALDQLELDRARVAIEREAATSRARELTREVAAIAAEAAALGASERELRMLERQHDMADDTLRTATRVLAERRLTEAEDALRLANVRVIQPARVPMRPTPLKLLLVLGGFLGGTLAATGVLLWGFVARPSFFTARGLAEASGLPVLGVFRAQPAPAEA